jgi:hypothetical protein
VFKTWSYGVMLSVLPSSVIDHVFKTWSYGVMLSVLPSSVMSTLTITPYDQVLNT